MGRGTTTTIPGRQGAKKPTSAVVSWRESRQEGRRWQPDWVWTMCRELMTEHEQSVVDEPYADCGSALRVGAGVSAGLVEN